MTPSVQNLNAKLSPRPRPASPRVAAAKNHLAAGASPTPVRVSGRADAQLGGGYRGGYLIDV